MGKCLKCGNKTEENAVFCPDCLAVMDTYPVKPGTVAHLQPRPQRAERKAPESYQESVVKTQLLGMRRTVRWLIALTLILSVLLMLTAGMLIQSIGDGAAAPAIGRNYTTTQQP